jgi:8-amino-7-oxononanoate synthase
MTGLNQRLKLDLAALDRSGLRRQRRVVTPLADGWCTVNGRRLRNLASNDYLNLSHDARVVSAARAAMLSAGVGASASQLVAGFTPWHQELASTLAEFEGTEAAILFPSGYAANLGVVSALADEKTSIFSDRLNHACLIDGARLSGSRLQVFRRQHLDRLERALVRSPADHRKLILTDGVFSMDGDLAPLRELCEIAERVDAAVLVDEAHGTGVFGDRGRGACEAAGVESRVAVRIGTLSKAIGCAGGFVAGSKTLVDWLWNHARTQMFSTAIPPAVCAAATIAVRVIQHEPNRRMRLLDLSRRLRCALVEAGVEVPAGVAGPIIPVIAGSAEAAVRASARLEEAGWLVPAIRPPTVPRGTSRLRISLTAAFTEHEIRPLVDAVVSSLKA